MQMDSIDEGKQIKGQKYIKIEVQKYIKIKYI